MIRQNIFFCIVCNSFAQGSCIGEANIENTGVGGWYCPHHETPVVIKACETLAELYNRKEFALDRNGHVFDTVTDEQIPNKSIQL